MSGIQQFSFKRIADTLFLHDVNIKRLHHQSDFRSYFKMMVILHQEFISAAHHRHFIMHTFENRSFYHAYQLRHIRNGENIKIFRTDDYVYRNIFTKSFIHTFKLRAAEAYQLIMNHGTIEDIAFSDKVGNKSVDGFIININRCTDLLNFSFTHHNNRITQRQCLFLIVSDVNKCYTQRFMHFFELHLHILTHFQVERCQRLIQ